jgi:hypothetical protein
MPLSLRNKDMQVYGWMETKRLAFLMEASYKMSALSLTPRPLDPQSKKLESSLYTDLRRWTRIRCE